MKFVDRATQALRRQSEALRQSNEELESFAYVASHDLKAPLTGVFSWAEILGDDLDAMGVGRGANVAVEEVIEDLLIACGCSSRGGGLGGGALVLGGLGLALRRRRT